MSERKVECLFLSKSEVESLITRKDIIDAVEIAFMAAGTGQLVQPQKDPMWMDLPDKKNFLIAMPTYLKSINTAGIKWANLYWNRGDSDIPATFGDIIILNKPETGLPYAIMDGTAITNLRTAGGHAVVSAKHLAKKDSNTLAIIGCGAEAYTGFPAFMDNFPIEQVKICDIRPEAMDTLQKEMSKEFSVPISASTSAQESVKGADIILMITSSPDPVVLEQWVEPGCFVAGTFGFYDLDPMLSKKADKWILGSRQSDEHLIINAGGGSPLSVEITKDDVYADMGEIVAGVRPGRENDQERIVFTHLGMGAHDISLAQIAYTKAVEEEIGIKVYL
ncbi:MAG: hypothetical protein JRI52_08265 [Deltaproteobacteria bacterium]|nr:hypothetical protein [Deltaproteobacteria bacterium]